MPVVRFLSDLIPLVRGRKAIAGPILGLLPVLAFSGNRASFSAGREIELRSGHSTIKSGTENLSSKLVELRLVD